MIKTLSNLFKQDKKVCSAKGSAGLYSHLRYE